MHHRQMLSQALLASFVRFAKFGDVPLLQAFVTNARAETDFPLFFRRRFLERVACRQLMTRAALRAASRRRRISAVLARCSGSGRDFGAGKLGARLVRVGAAHRANIPFG